MYPCARPILITNVKCNTLCGGQTVRGTGAVRALQSALSRSSRDFVQQFPRFFRLMNKPLKPKVKVNQRSWNSYLCGTLVPRCEFPVEALWINNGLFEGQKMKQIFISSLIISFWDPKPSKVKAWHFFQTSRITRLHCVMSQKTSIHDTAVITSHLASCYCLLPLNIVPVDHSPWRYLIS